MFLKVCGGIRAPWGPHPRGRSRAGPQQDSFASKIYSNSGKLMWKDYDDLKNCCWDLPETGPRSGKLWVSLW